MMRVLRYPTLISISSFDTPNFELVADILSYLVQRYDPEIPLQSHIIETPEGRIHFIITMVREIQDRAGLGLDAKRLYAADGHAVRELMKLAFVLTRAYHEYQLTVQDSSSGITSSSSTTVDSGPEDGKGQTSNSLTMSLQNAFPKAKAPSSVIAVASDRTKEAKQVREMASQFMECGAKLHTVLSSEHEWNESREKSIQFLDAAADGIEESEELKRIQKVALQLLDDEKRNSDVMEQECEKLGSTKQDLEEKMKKRQLDLERNKKRLQSLKEARPAFMDEFESLEGELQDVYEMYMERQRNVHYLKNELIKYKEEDEAIGQRAERSMRRVQRKIKEEEMTILRGDRTGSVGDHRIGRGVNKGNKRKKDDFGNISSDGSSIFIQDSSLENSLVETDVSTDKSALTTMSEDGQTVSHESSSQHLSHASSSFSGLGSDDLCDIDETSDLLSVSVNDSDEQF